MTRSTRTTRRRTHRSRKDGLVRWSDPHAAAWIGLLETHKRLTRELEAQLNAEQGLSISGLELLSRLADAPDRTMRLSALAESAGLSLSRVSRIIDALEERGLVERQLDTVDTRARNACLTPAGLELLQSALKSHFAAVERLFFDRVSDEEVEILGAVFDRFRRYGTGDVQ
jgi:DNA-binding MarR family transcriptional regulator